MRERLQAFVERNTSGVFAALALVVGVLSGLGGALMIEAIGWIEDAVGWVESSLAGGRLLTLVTVPIGLLSAWALSQRFPELRGSGVPATIAGLAVRSGYIPTRASYLKIVATALTLGMGGSAGREGPTVMVGASIGSSLGRYSGLGEDQVRSLVAAGAGAGIGATFNAPIAGMLFSMEVILGNFAIRHLNAVVIASVAAAVTTRAIVGADRILSVPSHNLGDPTELALYTLLGLMAAAAGFLFLKVFDRVHSPIALFDRRPLLRPLILGIPVAIIVTLEPRTLGTGQAFIQEIVGGGALQYAWWVFFALIGLKILATAGTLGSHASGGHFMPALFIGSALGAGFGDFVRPFWAFSDLDTGAFAVVGMAAVFAAVARAPMTAILIVFELTGDYGLVLPLMLATSLAAAGAERLHKESVYTIPLVRQGIRLVKTSDVDLLDTVEVGDVMTRWTEVLRPSMSTGEVIATFNRHGHRGLPVVDEDEGLVGILTMSDITRSGGPSDQVRARDVMTPRPVTVTPETPVSLALERMASLGVGRLPVVSESDPRHLLGLFRRETAVRAYHHALSETTEHELRRKRQRIWANPDAEFFEFHIPSGSVADGRPIMEVHWPAGCTLVAVRRGRAVLIPEGNTELKAGDIVTGFGAPAARKQVHERMRASSDDDVPAG